MIHDEVCVGQRALQVMAHRLASGRAGVGGERLMAVRRKLLQGVAHRAWHSVLGKNLRENARAPGRFPPERCGATFRPRGGGSRKPLMWLDGRDAGKIGRASGWGWIGQYV